MKKIHLFVALAFTGLLLPVCASASKANFVRDTEHTCQLHLASGQLYTLQSRTFRWKKNATEVYTAAVSFYAPGSGEFLWWGMNYTPHGYLTFGRNYTKPGCTDTRRETLLLQDGEWADFLALDSSLRVFHSNLKFPSIDRAWQYVAEHPDETSSWEGGKWVESIDLYKVLGPDFFHRPERLRDNAVQYVYDPLISVNRVGSTWQLQIQGTDDRAFVVLDKNFRVVKVAKELTTTRLSP